MRLIHTKGFSVSERRQWKVTIFQNLLHAFQVVFGAMEEQEVDFAEDGNIVRHFSFTLTDFFANPPSRDLRKWLPQTQISVQMSQCPWIVYTPSRACGWTAACSLPLGKAMNMRSMTISHSKRALLPSH